MYRAVISTKIGFSLSLLSEPNRSAPHDFECSRPRCGARKRLVSDRRRALAMTDEGLSLLTRRDLLRVPLVAAAAAVLGSSALGLGGCSPGPEPPQTGVSSGTTGIDVHCHVFNAR